MLGDNDNHFQLQPTSALHICGGSDSMFQNVSVVPQSKCVDIVCFRVRGLAARYNSIMDNKDVHARNINNILNKEVAPVFTVCRTTSFGDMKTLWIGTDFDDAIALVEALTAKWTAANPRFRSNLPFVSEWRGRTVRTWSPQRAAFV